MRRSRAHTPPETCRVRRSIEQNPITDGADVALPDFRSPGVLARLVISVTAASVIVAVARSPDAAALPGEIAEALARTEPPLLIVLAALALIGPASAGWRWPTLTAVGMIASAVSAALTTIYLESRGLTAAAGFEALRAAALGAAAAAFGLHYLYLRGKAFSPAVTEARLMALTARIRPHFLFNSLNAVLGTIRSDPRRAEAALEELSDLFRVLMAENRELVPLGDELQLCRQYLDLERLRLGERLRVAWHLVDAPTDALVPPLMLQPLLENAVYHGIEPAADGGEIDIRITRQGGTMTLTIGNPYSAAHGHTAGNRMALDNIRERLKLFFDVEAQVRTTGTADRYRVELVMPYRRAGE